LKIRVSGFLNTTERTQLAIYYKMFRDSDDTHAPGQRYLLNLIQEDAEKWPDLKRALDKRSPPETTQPQSK
jgi:hypothetical protein